MTLDRQPNGGLSSAEEKVWQETIQDFGLPTESRPLSVPFDPLTENLADLLERLDSQKADGSLSNEDFQTALECIDGVLRQKTPMQPCWNYRA